MQLQYICKELNNKNEIPIQNIQSKIWLYLKMSYNYAEK